jgi:hypothetical protein
VCRFQPDNERNRTSTHCVGTNVPSQELSRS